MQRLDFMLDVTRDLYNALLQQRRDAYRRRGRFVTTIEQYKEITALRHDESEIGKRFRSVYRECLDSVLHRLDLSFTRFFRLRARGKAAGYPRFKTACRWRQIEFCHGNRALKLDEDQRKVRIPGVGWVRLRRGRIVPAFGRAWLKKDDERWYACFECERPMRASATMHGPVGIDLGVRYLVTTSDGEHFSNPRCAARWDEKIVYHRRAMEAGPDRSREKALARMRRANCRARNARRDYLHKVARRIVDRYSVVVLEELKLRQMTRSARGSIERPGKNVKAKAGLNRALLDASFTMLRAMIVAKAEEAGRRVIVVNPKYTSQTCAVCGYRHAKNRMAERFLCGRCAHAADADVNAAKVILQRAQSALMSDAHPGAESGSWASGAA